MRASARKGVAHAAQKRRLRWSSAKTLCQYIFIRSIVAGQSVARVPQISKSVAQGVAHGCFHNFFGQPAGVAASCFTYKNIASRVEVAVDHDPRRVRRVECCRGFADLFEFR